MQPVGSKLSEEGSRFDATLSSSVTVKGVRVIPAGARVLVISKGDPDLLDMEGRDAQHFPQDADGSYAGHHPAGSADAIGHLKSMQRAGAGYLLIPGPALWWLEHYAGLGEYLADVGVEAFRETDLCVIFRLSQFSQDD